MTFFFSLNLIIFFIICWHSYDISDASIDNFNYKIIKKTFITFFLCVCINISYVILKYSMFIKNVKKWLKSALFCKLKKVLLHFFFISKSHILKTFICTFNIVTISTAFIKCCYFTVTNIVFDISSYTFKTF